MPPISSLRTTLSISSTPVLISVVPDPVKVAQEMAGLPSGWADVFLNHFSPNPILSRLERTISPFTIHIGFKSDLDLPAFLTSRPAAHLDRKGELPAALVAGDGHQVALINPAIILAATCAPLVGIGPGGGEPASVPSAASRAGFEGVERC